MSVPGCVWTATRSDALGANTWMKSKVGFTVFGTTGVAGSGVIQATLAARREGTLENTHIRLAARRHEEEHSLP